MNDILLWQQLHFHQPGSTTLFDYIPQDILPTEYGGKAGTVADIKGTWEKKKYRYLKLLRNKTKKHIHEIKY